MTAAPTLNRPRSLSTFEVAGADGQPVIIPSGQWYMNPKARPQRLMRNSLSAEARQVYACLELATMGFQQEECVTMFNGRKIPLTSKHLTDQTGLSKQHVRRAFTELEAEGLAERRATGDKGLIKGQIAIYSWAIPRVRSKEDQEKGAARGSLFARLGEEFKPLAAFAKRWKITPDTQIEPARGSLLSALEAIAQAEKAQMEAIAIVKGVIAPSRLNKEERNCKEPKEHLQSHPTAAAAFPTMPAAAVTPSPLPEPQAPASPHSVPVAATVAQELAIDDDAAQRLVAGCRAVEPSITGPEIVGLARQKLFAVREQIRTGKIASVVGLLISHVPKMCAGATLQAVRDQIEAARQDRAARIAYAREAWPELNEEDRAEALQKYPELAELVWGAR